MLRDGEPVDLGGARAQTLIALLALRAGSPVSTELLVDELWAGEAPDGALTTLRSYVSRLRTALGDGVSIERVTAGYVLAIPPEAVDAVRFEAAIREAEGLIERGRNGRAAEALRSTLELWRGEPFAGLSDDGTLRAEATRLEGLRLHALEARLGSELEAGRAAELVDEIEGLLAAHPFRERLWRHLMLALYRAGRQADALAAYHRARAALDEQLGIEPGPELRELEAAILRQDVPQAGGRRPGSGALPGSLPVPLTRFIGRGREIREIRALVERARLVTLIGVGGVGKTRLALELAAAMRGVAVDRVALVDLAALTDPGLIQDHVAAALGAIAPGAGNTLAAIAEEIGTEDVLLVLDNCEHVRSAAAELAQALLAGAPDLRILATSRVALDVAGEAPYPVPPLALTAGPDEAQAHGAASSEAVELLLDRATLTRHDLVVDAAAYETATRICADLDGLPLAIELAAARLKALSLDEIAVRLRDRFQFLVSWRRLTSARHRTLRETMDWSYELLEPGEQRLLVRLSVFPAGATSASIAAVCGDGDEAEAERLIERLVDASLLVPLEGVAGSRYRLLETVRQYAEQRLPENEREPLHRRHAAHVLALARSTNLSLEGTGNLAASDLAASFQLAGSELPSIRSAIDWAARNEPALGAGIAVALERFWVSNHPAEGIAVFTRLLEAGSVPDELRARVLRARGGARYGSGAFHAAVEDYEAALAIHGRLQEPAYEAHLLLRLAFEAHRLGDNDRAHALLAQAEKRGGGDRFSSDRYVSLSLAGDLAFDEGRVDDALALEQEAGDLAAEAGDAWWRSDTMLRLAERALRTGRPAVAAPAARDALRWARSIDDRQSTVYGLALLAWEAAATGDLGRAGRIWAGLLAEVERGGPVGQWELEEEAFRAEIADDSAAFRAGAEFGRTLPLADVVEEALSPG